MNDGPVGFTGTRRGLTHAQRHRVQSLLVRYRPIWIIHGDAVGADAEADAIAADLRIPRKARPSNVRGQRAFCRAESVLSPKAPLARNAEIVDECSWLIACPDGEERTRSGTWSTVRAARRIGRAVVLVMPDGSEVRERWADEPEA